MGLLDFFSSKKEAPMLDRLPSGSFTVDRDGTILTSTLPHSFPQAHTLEIGKIVMETILGAREANVPVAELSIHFSGLKITAKEQRGGAMIFLAPIR
jgi:hypothetical protein